MSFIRAHYILIGNAAKNGQPDNDNAMQFGARLGTAIPNPFIDNANCDNAMQFGARWGLVVPNLFIDNATCDNASCDNASCDERHMSTLPLVER